MPHKNRTPVRIDVDDPHFAAWRKTRRDAELLEAFFEQPELQDAPEPEPRRRRPAPPFAVAYAPFIVGAGLIVVCLFLLAVLH